MKKELVEKHGIGHFVNTDLCNAMCCVRNAQSSMNEGNNQDANEWIEKAMASMANVSSTATEIDNALNLGRIVTSPETLALINKFTEDNNQ